MDKYYAVGGIVLYDRLIKNSLNIEQSEVRHGMDKC